MLSDVFTDKSQFDWMLSTFLNIYRSHPVEDELTMQYLVVGICKAAAVVGLVTALLSLSTLSSSPYDVTTLSLPYVCNLVWFSVILSYHCCILNVFFHICIYTSTLSSS